MIGKILLNLFYLYVAAGIVAAAAFACFGVTRVISPPAPVTIPARILLLPAAFIFWPYVLVRWFASGRSP